MDEASFRLMRATLKGKDQLFWGNVQKGDGCWSYTSGFVMRKGTVMGAVRFAWIDANGPIKKGLSVWNKCGNGGCVNPDHLFLATRKQMGHSLTARANELRRRA